MSDDPQFPQQVGAAPSGPADSGRGPGDEVRIAGESVSGEAVKSSDKVETPEATITATAEQIDANGDPVVNEDGQETGQIHAHNPDPAAGELEKAQRLDRSGDGAEEPIPVVLDEPHRGGRLGVAGHTGSAQTTAEADDDDEDLEKPVQADDEPEDEYQHRLRSWRAKKAAETRKRNRQAEEQ